jgi:hypothetical protein
VVTVYEVSKPSFPLTRIQLPSSAWGQTVREKLAYLGFIVKATDQSPWPDTRDRDELVRRDRLLMLINM